MAAAETRGSETTDEMVVRDGNKRPLRFSKRPYGNCRLTRRAYHDARTDFDSPFLHLPPPLPTATNMDVSFALTGKGYVLIAADTTAARSIVKMKSDEDKIKVLSPHLLMAYGGEPGT